MCTTFDPDCRYYHSIINLIGNVYLLNQMYSCKLCGHKGCYLTTEAIMNVRNALPRTRCAILPLKIKETSFSFGVIKGYTSLKGWKGQ